VALRTGIAVLAVLACLAAPAAASAADPVIGAAGDIACASFSATSTSCQQKATSDLLVGAGYAKVLSLGDQQYENGTLADFNKYYEASWGRVKTITAPVPGNHEYQTSGASGYYSYFGALAGPSGKGYYSFDLGSWHLVGLNSNCSKVSCSAGSTQEQWLRSDLAAHPRQCVLAFFHHANLTAPTTALRQAFLAAGGDVILTGHNHVYRRLGPRDASLNADPGGYREFIVGTGGKSVSGSPFGILQLTLHSASYDWKFISIAHATGDTGSASCNAEGSRPTAAFSATPTSGTAPLNVSFTDQSSGSPTSWAWDFQNDGLVDSNVRSPTFQYSAPGTYSVKLTATNGLGSNSLLKSGYITVSPGGGTTSVTYLPSDDAYVRSNFPDENTGTAPTLRAYKSSTAQTDSFLRFSVGAQAGSVKSAKLRLFVRDASPNGGLLSEAATNWSEGALTWTTRPATETATIASAGAVALGTWLELDVTSVVTGQGPYSFVLRGASSDVAYYDSEEATNKPQLVVTSG
jgi:PKD repeat protein